MRLMLLMLPAPVIAALTLLICCRKVRAVPLMLMPLPPYNSVVTFSVSC